MGGSTSVKSAHSVDVVICTYTDERRDLLCRAVDSVERQSWPPHEIAVCADRNPMLMARRQRRRLENDQSATPRVEVLAKRFEGQLDSARNTAVENASPASSTRGLAR